MDSLFCQSIDQAADQEQPVLLEIVDLQEDCFIPLKGKDQELALPGDTLVDQMLSSATFSSVFTN